MNNAIFNFKEPANEPIQSYLPGSKERELLESELSRQSKIEIEIPLIIGGKEIRTGNRGNVVMPHDHKHILAKYHSAIPEDVKQAIVQHSPLKKNGWNCHGLSAPLLCSALPS